MKTEFAANLALSQAAERATSARGNATPYDSIGRHAFRPGPFRAYRKPTILQRITRALIAWF